MSLGNPGRLAIYRRSDEVAFLQHRLRTLAASSAIAESEGQGSQAYSQGLSTQPNSAITERDLQFEVLMRERDLADELLHSRQIEPLGETLQRRLAMAERVCRDLTLHGGSAADRGHPADAHWVAEIERRALAQMLEYWWAWLSKS